MLCCEFCKYILLHVRGLTCAYHVAVLVFSCLEKRIYVVLSGCQQYSILVLNIFFLKTWFFIASSFSFLSFFYFIFSILYLAHVLEKSFYVRNIWQLCQKRKQTQFLVVENGSWIGVLFYKCVFWGNKLLNFSIPSWSIN